MRFYEFHRGVFFPTAPKDSPTRVWGLNLRFYLFETWHVDAHNMDSSVFLFGFPAHVIVINNLHRSFELTNDERPLRFIENTTSHVFTSYTSSGYGYCSNTGFHAFAVITHVPHENPITSPKTPTDGFPQSDEFHSFLLSEIPFPLHRETVVPHANANTLGLLCRGRKLSLSRPLCVCAASNPS